MSDHVLDVTANPESLPGEPLAVERYSQQSTMFLREIDKDLVHIIDLCIA